MQQFFFVLGKLRQANRISLIYGETQLKELVIRFFYNEADKLYKLEPSKGAGYGCSESAPEFILLRTSPFESLYEKLLSRRTKIMDMGNVG